LGVQLTPGIDSNDAITCAGIPHECRVLISFWTTADFLHAWAEREGELV